MPTADVLELRAGGPQPQRRLTVFFRFLLLIPHLVVLALIGYAALLATFMAWFAAVFTGRNPFHRFVSGYLRWSTRANAYFYFLTDRYPPFEFAQAPEYPVDIELAQGALRRVTVFFRLLLALPALLLVMLLRVGMAPIAFVAWLLTLFRGSLPAPVHQAFQASLRFEARASAYLLLLQDPYPRGLFGDVETFATPPVPPVPAPAPPPPAPARTVTDDAPLNYAWPPEVTAPAPPMHDTTSGGPSWRLTLSRGARRLVITEIVLGVVLYAVYIPLLGAVLGSHLGDDLWAAAYRGDIVTLSGAVATARLELASPHPDWAALGTTCGTGGSVGNALQLVSNDPEYPSSGPNRYLLAGVTYVTLSNELCGQAVAAKDANALPTVARGFARGASDLSTFLRQIPT